MSSDQKPSRKRLMLMGIGGLTLAALLVANGLHARTLHEQAVTAWTETAAIPQVRVFQPKQNASGDSLSDNPTSRPTSPPPNPVLHSTPAKTSDKKHKMDPNEVSPIFHQFLDAVFQLQWQAPDAFEFNERFLRRLFYQVYAGQY